MEWFWPEHTILFLTCPIYWLSWVSWCWVALKCSFSPSNFMIFYYYYYYLEKIHILPTPHLYRKKKYCPWQKVNSKTTLSTSISRRMPFFPCHFDPAELGYLRTQCLQQQERYFWNRAVQQDEKKILLSDKETVLFLFYKEQIGPKMILQSGVWSIAC